MKNQQKERRHNDLDVNGDRCMMYTHNVVVNKNKNPNEPKYTNIIEHSIAPSITRTYEQTCQHKLPRKSKCPHGHSNSEFLRPSLLKCPHNRHRDDKARLDKCTFGHKSEQQVRPTSCPHGHTHELKLKPPPCALGCQHDDKVRPASCPYKHKHERDVSSTSYTCPFGHTHEPTIICPRPILVDRNTKVTNPPHKRRFYSVNAPREPLIQAPTTFSCNFKVNSQVEELQKMPPTAQLKKIPFCKSYKYVNLPPRGARMTWTDYHRLNVIHEFLDTLETAHPALCSAPVIGHSLEKRDIKILKISNNKTNICGVWMDAGIHAREWIGPAVNTYVANYLASHFKSLPSFITNKDWFFLPVANPDGYEYTHTTDRMWRKNKAYVNGKCVGVDLNRNFSFGWGGQGSSDSPQNSFYRGPRPFSEPESCAIRDFISSATLPFRVYITLHSYGEVIIFPFADNDNLCPGYIRLLQGATVMSKAIHRTNGRVYKVGISKDMMYRASGTSNDWSHGVVGIPYCYLMELRSRKDRIEDYSYKNSKCRFKVPSEEIEETGNEILNSIFALMEFIDSYPEDKLIAENPTYAIPKQNTMR